MKNLKKMLSVLLIVSMTLSTQGTYVLAENVEKVFETHDNIVHENYGIEAENNLLVVSDNIHETQDENMKKESSSDEEKDLITGTAENVIPSENDNIDEEDDVNDEKIEESSEEETLTDDIEATKLNEDIISESETSEDIALDEDASKSSDDDSMIESENVIGEKENEIVDEEKKATDSDTDNLDKKDEINIYDIVESTTSETYNILLMGEEEKKSTVSEIDLDELAAYKNKTLGNIDDDYVAPIAKQSMLFGAGEIPSSWDSREHYNETTGLSYVPPVRNQNPYGICWSFATTGMFETSIRKKGLVKNDKESNLSELALAYFMYNLKGVTSDPNYCGKPGLQGDDYTLINDNYFIKRGEPEDATWSQCGGNQALSTKMLTSFAGMIVEDDLTEYTTNEELNDAMKNLEAYGLPKEYAFNKSAYVPKNIKYINRSNRDQIKQAIMENGSVGFSYFAEGNDGLATHWDENGSYYHSNGRTSTNHAIMIVGWDDNIDAKKFYYGGTGPTGLHYETIEGEKVIVGTNPPTEEEYEASTNKSTSNGAWLARNSWGTTQYFLKDGYFYIPYDEPSLSDTFFSVDAISADTYKYNYHYDTSGVTSSVNRKYHGNVFKVSGDDEKQFIEAVNIGVNQTNAEYNIKIYTNDNQMNTPTDGTLVKELRGSNESAGFYTFDLDEPIVVKKDTYFSVVLEAYNSDSLKIFCDDISTGDGFYHTYNEIAEKQSFFRKEGYTWTDAYRNSPTEIDGKTYGTSMRIKAYGSAAVDVSFNYNGKGSDYSETHKKGDIITKPEDPTYEGYKFVHWYKEGTSEDTAFEFSKAISEEDGTNIVLMAKWEPITYTIAYDIGGATFATKPSDINHEYGTSISLSDPSAIADGYRFAGWFTDTDYDDTHKYVGGDDNELSTTDRATVSLYAKWEVRTSYNANGRGTAPATSWSLLNENITLPTITDVEGYKFDTINSWYDGSDISTANFIGAAGGTYKVIESKELFANWVKLGTTKTITFNDNFSGATFEQEFTVGADTAIRTDVFTRSGYTFVGWKDKSGVAYTNTKELTDDIILYAEWQQNPAPYVPSGNDGGSSSSSSSGSSSSGSSSTGGPIPQNQINQQVEGQETAKETLVSTSQSEQIVLNAVGSQWLYDPLSSSWKLNALDLTGAPAIVANGFFILNQVTLVNENNNLVPKNVQDTYYFDAVGNMVTGWVKTNDNKWYFFDNAKTINEGKLCIGWKQIGSDWYCFSSIDGSMLSNTVTADGYKLGSDGKWIP